MKQKTIDLLNKFFGEDVSGLDNYTLYDMLSDIQPKCRDWELTDSHRWYDKVYWILFNNDVHIRFCSYESRSERASSLQDMDVTFDPDEGVVEVGPRVVEVVKYFPV